MSGRSGNIVMLPLRPSRRGEAPWEILDLLPVQGQWSVEAYRNLPTEGPLIELNQGCLEVLPMPDWIHQTLMGLIWMLLRSLEIDGKLGRAVMPPFNLHTLGEQYRHPDVMFLLPKHLDRFREGHWTYADLVVEILSANDPNRDLVDKRAEYAKAGVPEYWIIDPAARTLLVLALDGEAYREVQTFGPGDVVRSPLLPSLTFNFGNLLAQAEATAP